jgi:hypothetical protein
MPQPITDKSFPKTVPIFPFETGEENNRASALPFTSYLPGIAVLPKGGLLPFASSLIIVIVVGNPRSSVTLPVFRMFINPAIFSG